jgi:hypothetical protein
MEQIECSETSAIINQTPGNRPKEDILNPKNLLIKFSTWWWWWRAEPARISFILAPAF